ncbi:hypothetical protein, partial [Pseudomonas costantinii]|uniref:hypothetical protein n=1 Tax=Pseudomonas costantinii TaxID=168469 RepID=UPI001C430085
RPAWLTGPADHDQKPDQKHAASLALDSCYGRRGEEGKSAFDPHHSGRLSGRRAFAFDFDLRHTEPQRGAEWWGKSPLVTLGWAGIPAFPK